MDVGNVGLDGGWLWVGKWNRNILKRNNGWNGKKVKWMQEDWDKKIQVRW